MEGKEEDARLGGNKFNERQPLGTSAQTRDYKEPTPAPLFEPGELQSWSFWRAGIAGFMTSFVFLYITCLNIMCASKSHSKCPTRGIQRDAWVFGGTIFATFYSNICVIPGGLVSPYLPFGLSVAMKMTLNRVIFYVVMQCLGIICGAGVIFGGGADFLAPGYRKGDGLVAEIVGTFVLVYTAFFATDAKKRARDSRLLIFAPLPIWFAVFLLHLAAIPITGTGINPARSLGATILYNRDHAWDDQWIFCVGPFIGAALAVLYHQVVKRDV